MNTDYCTPRQAELQNIVHSFWQTDGIPGFRHETIIPKGIIEIIFNFSRRSAIKIKIAGREFHLSKTFITGFNTCPVAIELPVQQTFFGIRFYPAAIRRLLKVPSFEFTNRVADLELIDIRFNSLWHQLMEKEIFDRRVEVISDWIREQLIEVNPREKLLNDFLSNFQQPVSQVSELSRNLCYSPRHLYRKLHELTGINTEEILLHKKYFCAVELIHSTNYSLTEIAYASGFADQSHFTRTFRLFAEMTPGQYQRQKSDLPGHLYQNVR